jgi:hypothetical protein
MSELKEIGYARMRVKNYRKNGDAYYALVTVFPIFDTVTPLGLGSCSPILTHFAAVLSDVDFNSNYTNNSLSNIIDDDLTEHENSSNGGEGLERCGSHFFADKRVGCQHFNEHFYVSPDVRYFYIVFFVSVHVLI